MSLLRNDLELFPWEPDPDGTERWVIQDPARNLFFNVTRDVIEVLKRIHLKDPEKIAAQISQATPLSMTGQDVNEALMFFHKNKLLNAQSDKAQEALTSEAEKNRTTLFQWLTHKYLFIRVPLVKPDEFLSRSLPWVRPLLTRWFRYLTLVVGLIGIMLSLRDWDALEQNLIGLFSIKGVVMTAITLVFVKLIHELAHAYVAKRHGVRIPIMGIAFLVMFPLPYTDTSESWKLYRHRDRLGIAAAGVTAELMLAAWATLLWKLVPDGAVQQALFLIATTTWISSVIVNVSPFMRFDGYFVLMDYLRFPNLHGRSGALAQWRMREFLFGLGAPCPEQLPAKFRRRLITFASFVWLYRMVVFFGIALLVYHFFIKSIGILLFCIEIYYFILRPILREIKAWWDMRMTMKPTVNLFATLGTCIAILVGLFIPFSRDAAIPAVYIPTATQTVYAPQSGIVSQNMVSVGQTLLAGAEIGRLASPDLEQELAQAELRAIRQARYAQLVSLGATATDGVSGRGQAFQAIEREIQSLRQQRDSLNIQAPQSGRVNWINPEFTIGTTVAKGSPLITLDTGNRDEIITYVTDRDIGGVQPNTVYRFVPHSMPHKTIWAKFVSMSPSPVDVLGEPQLDQQLGGGIPATGQLGNLKLVTPAYRVALDAKTAVSTQIPITGNLFIPQPKESIVSSIWRQAANVVIREIDF